jgi:hypothetical protein
MAYPYTFEDLTFGIGFTGTPGPSNVPTGGIWAKLSNRNDVASFAPQAIQDACLEFSQNYAFQGLQRTTNSFVTIAQGYGPLPFSTWVNAADIPVFGTTANPKLIPSFFMFYNYPLNNPPNYNSGIGLTYKTIDALELMLQIPGTPAYWTRFNNQVYIAPQPIQQYYSYMRYQIQHPTAAPAAALTDIVLLDDDWREIIEYGAAMRIAGNLRMLDYAAQYKQTLYGDPKKPGDLGLYTARVSMQENDIVSNQGMRQIRPMNSRWL